MPKIPFLPSLLLACLAAAQAHAAGVDYLVEIDAPSALEDLLRHNLGILRWQGSDYIDREQLERLYEATPREIEALLAPQGYFNPKVESRMVPEGPRWRLRFTVLPGEPALIHDVDLSIAGAIRQEADFQSRWAELIEVWPLPIGADFTQSGWDAAKRRGLQALIIDRFPAAKIKDSLASIDPARNSAELSVLYDSGPRFTFGPLDVKGLDKYPRELVDRLATFEPGEGYSQQKLLDFQTALQNTPYFSSVFLDVPVDPSVPDNVPVRVELIEAPQHKTEVGLGYDTDKGPRASWNYRFSNLRRKGWIGTVGLNLQRSTQTFNVGVELPPDHKGYRYATSYKAEHEDISGLDKLSQTVGVQRSRLKGDIEVTQALQYVRSREKNEAERSSTVNRALIPSQSWTRRELDNLNDPRRGLILSWQLGGAAKALLSDTDFVRAWGRAAWYRPAGEDGLLLLRGEAGQVVASETSAVPSDWLFRAGGAGSVRGYDYQSLGVKNGSTVEGGQVLATGSVEYQHRVWGKWRAAVFADAGGAAADWTSFKAYKGYGVGARWASPVGPFALDLAYGADERKIRLHFALGTGF
ncbi:autotransporter assembly complex protein TamA [Chitinimonas koreensis]|uniref:autotransporter assembly complex protein TamA n=1 Tax=Chitinimonas koreensis TaxID=356302 RepID=UPI00146F94AF|nr:autotransporter assembly complex family protein [Chitinimonas koreensis]QNM94674.1 outer membrane protein assembly factor [Chitinimonas koreensis]